MQNPTTELYYFEVPEVDRAKVDFATIVMRRLRRRDELEASRWAKEFGTKDDRDDIYVMLEREQAEKVKIAIVAVDGEEVQHPFVMANDWYTLSWEYLRRWYAEVNGSDPDVIKKAKGTRISSLTEVPATTGVSDAGGEVGSMISPVNTSGFSGTRAA